MSATASAGPGPAPAADDLRFDDIDQDLQRFQQDEFVKDALSRGVDLRVYSRQVEEQALELAQLRAQRRREPFHTPFGEFRHLP